MENESFLIYNKYYIEIRSRGRSKYEFIYGFENPDDDEYKLTKEDKEKQIKKFILPSGYCGMHVIGYSCGGLFALYDETIKYSDQKDFSFGVNIYCPEEVKKYIDETFSNRGPKMYALLQNVSRSHYACGVIMHGFIFSLSEERENDKDEKVIEYMDDGEIPGISITNHKLVIQDICHGFDEGSYFIGFYLNEIKPCESIDDCHDIANDLLKTYPIREQTRSFLRSDEMKSILSTLDIKPTTVEPVVMFVPTMCTCCT
jgi:hypothetical protein